MCQQRVRCADPVREEYHVWMQRHGKDPAAVGVFVVKNVELIPDHVFEIYRASGADFEILLVADTRTIR